MTAKLISIDPLCECSVQPLCLCIQIKPTKFGHKSEEGPDLQHRILWQQGVASFAITANTVICPLPSCVPDITTIFPHKLRLEACQCRAPMKLVMVSTESPVYLLCKFVSFLVLCFCLTVYYQHCPAFSQSHSYYKS